MISIKDHKNNPYYNKEIHISKDIIFLVNMKKAQMKDWKVVLSDDPFINIILRQIEDDGSIVILNIIRELKNKLMKDEIKKLIEGT